MCLISDHWDDLQHGSVLCHQEQQGGYINGESTLPLKHSLSKSSAQKVTFQMSSTPPAPDPVTFLQFSNLSFVAGAPLRQRCSYCSLSPAHEDFFFDAGML